MTWADSDECGGHALAGAGERGDEPTATITTGAFCIGTIPLPL